MTYKDFQIVVEEKEPGKFTYYLIDAVAVADAAVALGPAMCIRQAAPSITIAIPTQGPTPTVSMRSGPGS